MAVYQLSAPPALKFTSSVNSVADNKLLISNTSSIEFTGSSKSDLASENNDIYLL